MQKKRKINGLTLVELMIAGAILTTVALSLVGVMGNMATAVTASREISLANHLAEEKIESIRSLSFYAIMVSSVTPPALDTNFNPPIPYDEGFYPPEEIILGGSAFYRRTFVEKVATPSGYVEDVGYPHPDTGMKRINVVVSWQQQDATWKKIEMSSLSSNPEREALDKNMFGIVTDSVSGAVLEGVQVLNKRNPGQGAPTDVDGYYTFNTTDNDMKLIASKYGYEQFWTSSFNIDYGTNEYNFSMVPLSSAIVNGYVITYSSVVISGVNLQWDVSNPLVFIELYNGSTNPINVSGYQYSYVDAGDVSFPITITSVTASAPANGYFLLLGSAGGVETMTPAGTLADATFDSGVLPINSAGAGGLIIQDSGGNDVDKMAWGGNGATPPNSAVETTGLDLSPNSGPLIGNTMARISISTSTEIEMAPTGIHYDKGNAWDSQNNNNDFVLVTTQTARNSSTINVPQGGRTLPNAVVNGEDSVTVATFTDTNGYFNFYMQTGGPYNLTGASSSKMGINSLTVADPGPTSTLLWAIDVATVGFITGTLIEYGGAGLKNKIVQADPGEFQDISANDGTFLLMVPADESYYVSANPNFASPNWNTAISPDAIYVGAGEINSGLILSCWANSFVTGYVTTNGVDGLPGIPVQALGSWSNGNSSITDEAGYYVIPGLRIAPNPYTVFPVLLSDQVSTPENIVVTVVKGQYNSGNDFVVSNGRVSILGQAFYNSQPISSGVNVIASTTSISASNPPDITHALRLSGDRSYQSVTDGQGNYSLSVVVGETYNLVAWYTDASGTTSKTTTVTIASNTTLSGINFSWP